MNVIDEIELESKTVAELRKAIYGYGEIIDVLYNALEKEVITENQYWEFIKILARSIS